MRPLLIHCTNSSSFPAANTGSLDVQLWIHAPLCAGRVARTPRRAAMSSWRSDHAKDHADMRLTSGSHVVVASATAFRSPRAAENQFRAPAWTGIVFQNSRISLNAGRRACEPAAKPAIPGVILVHNGFVWPERTHIANLLMVLVLAMPDPMSNAHSTNDKYQMQDTRQDKAPGTPGGRALHAARRARRGRGPERGPGPSFI
jgi:hypothetical protein